MHLSSSFRICGTVLSGNAASLIEAAVESGLEFCDQILLVDTGITDDTKQRFGTKVGGRGITSSLKWTNDFAAARNFAMQEAMRIDAQYAMTLDTDERVFIQHPNPRQFLAEQFAKHPDVVVWMVRSKCGSYAKERFFKLPIPDRMKWSGRTHECFTGYNHRETAVLRDCYFDEVKKSPEQMQHKLERDLRILLEVTGAEPNNARWWYFLGQTYKALQQKEEAIQAYTKAVEIPNAWREQAACSAYCAATLAYELKDFDRSLAFCCSGLQRESAWPELFWLAGLNCFQLKLYADAITWSEASIAIGHYSGRKQGENRVLFRFSPGWFECPFEVLLFTYRRLGKSEDAERMKVLHQQAKQTRLDLQASRVGISESEAIPSVTTWYEPVPVLYASDSISTAKNVGTLDATQSVNGSRTTRLRLAILGCYRSGSSVLAGILEHLGIDMGAPYWGDYYEPQDLSEKLRIWWTEPHLIEAVSKPDRVRYLQEWIQTRENTSQPIGAKHPLLSMSPSDLVEAWGDNTKFIWTSRPPLKSIESLVKLGWWKEPELIQLELWYRTRRFLESREHLVIEFRETLADPAKQIDSLIEYLGINPTAEQIADAIQLVRRPGGG